ncbi:hypothetical protein BDZ90DRAFT_233352 [Jaminaea rosea]|uniref:TPR-like protein n=1 Tax=Jaminaea rosea TaxID=1569628 RepID=A0A316ULT2_9BASI|nr:hypothetical protein BDZ90DRAFT_233352 [Jaminaea rosea]PWN26217.1 hypothetical protein BDZ90DRAFT_233352 [Jaminaea rosea]
MSAGAYTKAKLKESREAIQNKAWDDARQAAQHVLEQEPNNYNANVFLGLALLNLGHFDDSEKAYLAAIDSQPSQTLAYQGLEKFYEQRKQWDKLVSLLQRQADAALEAQDAHRCAECIQRIVVIQQDEGAKSQKADALAMMVQGSKYHSLLEDSLPPPQPTRTSESPTIFQVQMAVHLDSLKIIRQIIELREALENDLVEKEVEKKRMRIDGAGKSRDTLRNEAGVEIWSNSKLPCLYQQVLSHADAADDERREAEAKLLRYQHRLLCAMPTALSDAKGQMRQRLIELAHGMVIVGVPDELAWSIHLEWDNSFGRIVQVPRHLLRQFIFLFPRSPRTAAFTALLLTLQDQRFLEERKELAERSDIDRSEDEQDALLLAIEAIDSKTDSVLAIRIAARLHLLDRDWSSAHDIATDGLNKLRTLEHGTALALPALKQDLQSICGIALTRMHGTQHQARALRLLDEVLETRLGDVDAIFARGQVDADAGRWQAAQDLFVKVAQRSVGEDEAAERALSLYKDPRTEARFETAWCDVQLGRIAEGKAELDEIIAILDDDAQQRSDHQRLFGDEDRARAWWRSGRASSLLADYPQSFNSFIAALKRYPSYAPAFAALGTYYEEHQCPPDEVRASKCFQKAFELDATQFHAAQKLAEHYAGEREWDLVGTIARRVIEGEGGTDALAQGAASASAKHKSQNAWAWKAIGIVRLEKGDAEQAISPLHVALRADSQDATSWQRLGEAYAMTGRLTAALKTLGRALELNNGDWQTIYAIAEVKRELGDFDDAIEAFEQILETRPDEFGVHNALAETQLLRGRREQETGYVQRARESFHDALLAVRAVLVQQPLLRGPWKVVADACSELAQQQTGYQPTNAAELLASLVQLAEEQGVDEKLPAVIAVKAADVRNAPSSSLLLQCAFFNKLRVTLCASEDALIGSAWADLALSLHRLGPHTAKEAIACIKEALNHEPANDSFWSLLGNLTFSSASIKVAQHAYIRAIESSVNDPTPWCNLGFLYLRHGDLELAEEAFVQARTVDPDYAHAWVGQAFVTAATSPAEAISLFAHAVELSEASLLEADYGFASILFDNTATSATKASLHSASFALSSYLSYQPSHAHALHLSALYAERLGEYALAIERIEAAAALLEEEFEQSEDSNVAMHFAFAQGNLARIRLANGDAKGAKASAEVALGLLEGDKEDEDDEAVVRSHRQARWNAQVTMSLAHHKDGDPSAAVATLQGVQGSQAAVLTAQIHFANGKVEEAKNTLLEAIGGGAQGDLQCIMTLGAIALVERDRDLLEAALSELDDGSGGASDDVQKSAPITWLRAIAHFMEGKDEEGIQVLANSGTALSLEVAEAIVRARLAKTTARSAGEALHLAQSSYINRDDEKARALRLVSLAAACQDESEASDEGETTAVDYARLAALEDPTQALNWQTLRCTANR